jgi:hypothetical protein
MSSTDDPLSFLLVIGRFLTESSKERLDRAIRREVGLLKAVENGGRERRPKS